MACHRRVVFLFAILCCWSGVAAAQFGDPPARRVSRPRPTTPTTPAKPAKPAQGLGQLVVQDAQSDSPVRLNVARYHAHVVLQPPAALVQIDQSFYNPYDRQEEGTFVFSLPRGASVSRFAMYVTPGQLVEGEMVERQRAASVYQTIVSRRRDPAILEQIGENLFKMRVFPIPPKDTKRILLDYTIPLESSAGECRFRLPLFSDLEPIWDFRLTGVIRAAVRTDGATSPSHPAATFKRDADGTVRFELTGQNYKPESDFLLSFAEQSTLEPAVRVCAVEPSFEPPFDGSSAARRKPGGLYFQATLPHDADPAAAKDVHGKATPPADVLVLVDTSTSMRDCPLVRQKLGEVLHKLRPADRFRVACVDVGARPLDDRWQKSGGPEVEKALGRFDQEFCLGGTDFDVALAEATALFDEKSPRRRLVICLGDGGQTDAGDKVNVLIGRLANRLQDAHAPLVAVLARGSEKGQMLMDWLARESGGLVFDLVGSAIAERDLDALLSSGLPSPEQIVKVEVEGAEPDDLYYPTAWLPDRALHVFGRVGPREKLRLTVTTADDGKPLERKWELAVDPKQDDVFVGRLWAQRKLDTLRRQRPFPKPEDPDDVLKKQMIALSQEWSLLSPYTAFLVLESEEDYARWEIDRRRRHRYWKPADAQEPEQLPEEWTRRAAERVKQSGKESDEKRLARTIRSAREALEGGNPSLADRLLDAIRNVPEATQSSEYTEMKRRAMAGIQREAVLGALGPCRALLDPATATPEPALDARLLPSLLAVPSASDDFGRRHPYAKQLLEEVPVRSRPWRPRKDRLVEETIFTVDELAAMLARDPSVNVVVDRRALENTRISTARELGVYGFGRMSLRDYARFLLGQAGLVLVEEPHRLLITTEDEAETRTTTEVYPVADLLIPDRVADPSLLFDPYLDHRLAAESRIRAKLQRPIDVEFDKTPLAEVVKKLGEILDGAVLVDEKSLEEDGFAFETPLTARWRGMPVKESLRWTLRDMNLTYIIRGGALVITTPDRALERLETRLHSGRGVLYEYAAPAEDRSRPGRSGGFTGGMGGMAMGSMGMGGMAMGAGGGVGAGMGGFAGGGFGMGGGLGVPQQGSAAGLSSGGDATVPNEAEASEPGGASMPESSGIDRPRPDTSLTLQASQRQEYTHDFDSLIELVTTTIKPASWDDLGGPGSIAFFAPTLDFVLTATEEVHDEIDVLFDRLRKLPQVSGARGWRPATLQPVDPDAPLDFDGLIGLLTSSIRPVSWDEVGGVGSVTFDEPRAVLIVSQTRDTQDEVSNMLTMLRRSRYEMLRGDRPWERKGLAAERPLVAPWPEADNPPPRLSAMPEPKSAELASLGDRQVESGLWEWRRSVPGKSGSQSIVLRRQGDRIEILLPGCVLRAEGDAVAIAWPGLRLVELGNWGEEVRRLADRRLPWLPHRANDELARLFHVTKTDAGRVRLVPAGLSEDANTWLEAEFAGPSRFPRLWQTQLDGKPTGRLRLDGKTAVMEDAADKVLARWELIRSETGDVEVPPLEADWQGYVR
ncbi:MAG: VIT domain-containing protein, partial [Planctomycetia bacterium]|nr:VIT domain-containing protein [Planctomycetia bacterium]